MSKTQKGSLANPAADQWRSVDVVTGEAGWTLSGTAASRRVLNESAATSAPSGAQAGFDVRGAEKLVLTFKATTATYQILLWEWDASSEVWAPNLVLGTQVVDHSAYSGALRVGVEVDGCHRAVVQVTSGTGGTVEGWARIVKREA